MHARHGHTRGLHHPRLYDVVVHLATRGRERQYRETLLDLARIESGQRVLDLGCGTGTTAIAAWHRVQPGGAVYGLDVSPKMIAAARRKGARSGGLDSTLHFQAGDAVTLPFQDAMFDTVMVTTVLHMVPDTERGAVLRETARVLRSGGLLLLVDFGGRERHGLMAKHRLHRSFELDAMRPLLPQAQLAVADAGALDWLGLRYLIVRKGAQAS